MKVKGYEIKEFNMKLASHRKAIQIHNDIIKTLAKIGVPDNDIELEIPRLVILKKEAAVEWWHQGYYLYFSYSQAERFIANLHIISKVLEAGVAEVLNGTKTLNEFCREFSEDDDIGKQRTQARVTLGVASDCKDLGTINRAYKLLAMKHHPDRPEGNHEDFKKINTAHKILKRELE